VLTTLCYRLLSHTTVCDKTKCSRGRSGAMLDMVSITHGTKILASKLFQKPEECSLTGDSVGILWRAVAIGMLRKSCCKYNITQSATAFIYVQM
jgi:hypothetical protein